MLSLLVVTACTKDDPDPGPDPYDVPDPPERGSTANRTVLIYMAADNDLGGKGFAADDLTEITEAVRTLESSIYTKNNVLVFYDQYDASQQPSLFRLVKKAEIKASENDASMDELVITAEREIIKEFATEIISTEPSTIREVMDLAYTTFPAHSYGFVYWSHGDGWLPGKYQSLALRSSSPLRWIGVDKENGTGSSDYKTGIPELAGVLKQAPKKLDFLLLDACFMMSVEVAYELRDCTNYLVASPTETPGPGGPYTKLVPAMFATNQAAIQIAEAYYGFYESKYNPNVKNTNSNWTGGVSITALDCSKLGQLAEVTSACLPDEEPDVQSLRETVFDYDKRSSYGHVGYYDMEDMMELIMTPENYVKWLEVYNQALAFWKTTPMNFSATVGLFSMEEANGVTHYILSPSDTSKYTDYRTNSWYFDAGLSKLGW
ncbi:MAG: peptidase C11 [Bacteroidaceae bacterium]|nr:peptidase C11 [Bacteroidaceae bacterium]